MMEEKTPTKCASEPKEQVYSPIAYSPIAEYEAVPRASPSDFLMGTNVASSDVSIRAAFIHKVYGILALQLMLTIAACSCFMYVPPLRNFITGLGFWAIVMLCIADAAVLVGCFLYKHRSPGNVTWLFAFTLVTSLLVARICAEYKAAGLGVLILEALGLALGIFVVLSAYTLIWKKDFTLLRGMIFVALWAVIGSVVVNFVFGVGGGKRSPFFCMIIACAGALLFSMYIVYDSTYICSLFVDSSTNFSPTFVSFISASKIMSKLSVDQYIEGTISLYLDVISLFLSVLNITSFLRN